MSGSSNFQQVNPTQSNQETDNQYAVDEVRTGGAATKGLCPASFFNKFAYQVSTFVAAFGQMMAAKGYVVSDADINSLAAQLANVMTQQDMSGFAPINSPLFTGNPQAPTPPDGDKTQTIPNTAWVSGLQSLAGSGYQKFPGGLIVNWITGPVDDAAADVVSHNMGFTLPFPNACLVALVSMNIASFSNRAQVWYQTIGWTKQGVTIIRQAAPSATNNVTSQSFVIALGF